MKKLTLIAAAAGVIVVAGGIALAADDIHVGPDGSQFIRTQNDEVKWVDYPGDGAAFGIKEAYMYGDPTKPGLYVIRIKFPKGVMSSPHAHPETRIGTVISGTWWTATGDKFDPKSAVGIKPGGTMIHPAGKAHYDGAITEDAVVQMMGIGPTGKIVVAKGPGFMKVSQ